MSQIGNISKQLTITVLYCTENGTEWKEISAYIIFRIYIIFICNLLGQSVQTSMENLESVG